jgi:(E)-4-hydroxy-3-methylbut-2-enyl-diphosphate synthase
LADGIGDTIRVSLAEEPEEEIPVAFALAGRPWAVDGPPAPGAAPPWDPFHYARRESRAVAIGPVSVGGGGIPAVVARAGVTSDGATAQVLRWASPGARRLQRPDIVVWPLAGRDDLVALQRLQSRMASARALVLLSATGESALPKLAILAVSDQPALLHQALPFADGVLLRQPETNAALMLARAAHAAGKSLCLSGVVPEDRQGLSREGSDGVGTLLAAVTAVRSEFGDELVVGMQAAGAERLIHAQRRLVTGLAEMACRAPVFSWSCAETDPLIPASLSLGSLLCDGIGDAVLATAPEAGQEEVRFTFNVLQAAGSRLSKTDYVACPSCGRTLFDLQATTERIKVKTSHLVGVKIAIMGCVVNGPGEMADADFGYVGGSPGHVNLYVGKTCVERSVPEGEADERLIALIKARGRWQEPVPADEE